MALLKVLEAPGLRYLLRELPKPLFVLSLGGVAFGKALQVAFGVHLSIVATLLAIVLLLPLAFTVKLQYAEYIKRRDARRLGAVLPPRVKSTRPGSFDVLRKIKGDKEGKMPGMFIAAVCQLLVTHSFQATDTSNGWQSTGALSTSASSSMITYANVLVYGIISNYSFS